MVSKRDGRIDFRRGNRASQRSVEAIKAIRATLSNEEATFGVLIERTGLSKRALASNLKKLQQRGEIQRRIDESDFRERHYFLTKNGWKETYKEALEAVMDVVEDQIVAELIAATGATTLLQYEAGKAALLPQLMPYEKYIFGSCFHGKITATTPDKKHPFYFDALGEFLANVKIVAQNKDIDIEPLKHLCDISFAFTLKREKLIEFYEKLKLLRDVKLKSAR